MFKKFLLSLLCVMPVAAMAADAPSAKAKASPVKYRMVDYVDLSDDAMEKVFITGMDETYQLLGQVRSGNRHSTGKLSRFYGYGGGYSQGNAADDKFNESLHRMYEMYCTMKGMDGENCLPSLKVDSYITTKQGVGSNNKIRVKVTHNNRTMLDMSTTPALSVKDVYGEFWKVLNTKFYSGEVAEYSKTLDSFFKVRSYVPMKIIILSDDSGNYGLFKDPAWLAGVTREMNKYPTKLGVGHMVTQIVLEKVSTSKSYNDLALDPLLRKYFDGTSSRNRTRGQINFVLTPKKQNTWGIAYVQNGTLMPAFATNGYVRYNANQMYQKNVMNHVARVWLHEVGHQMGYGHSGTPHCDNYYYHASGADRYQDYSDSLTNLVRIGRL